MFSFYHPRPVVSRRPVAELSIQFKLPADVRQLVLVAKPPRELSQIAEQVPVRDNQIKGENHGNLA